MPRFSVPKWRSVGLFACGFAFACSSNSTPADSTPGGASGGGAPPAAGGSAPVGASGAAAAINGGAGATAVAGDTSSSAGGGATASGGGASGGTAGSSAGNSNGGGGASSTAGASGSAGISSGGGAAGCPGLFCEDFESGKIDPAVWDAKSYKGQKMSVQTGMAAHGKYAVQFHNDGAKAYNFIITKNAPAGLRGHHFGRASFLVTPRPPVGHTEFIFSGSSGFPTYKYIELANADTAWQLTQVNLIVPEGGVNSATGTQEVYKPGGKVPLAKWSCIEWEFNDDPDSATVFVDGKQDATFPNITMNGKSSGLVGGFTDFGFGYYAWHPDNPFDIYYDDIVLDTKRIGCPT